MDTFAGIIHSTVNEWIDQKGEKPTWTATILKKAKQGNNPGHNKGRRQGVLVCIKWLIKYYYLCTIIPRWNILLLWLPLKLD
jgi:hypothetical protein